MFALYKMKVHLKLEPFELYCSLWWWSTWSKENHIAYNHLATSHAHAKETHVYSPVLLRLVFPHTRVLPFWWELVGAHGTTLYQCIMFHLCLNCFFLSSFLPSFLSELSLMTNGVSISRPRRLPRDTCWHGRQHR